MAVVCIDTHILIWGVQGVSRQGQEQMISRSQALLTQLERERTKVVVPSIVIGEFLLKLPVDEHPRYQDLISRRFMVVPYDLRAALLFSRIWHQKKDANVIQEMKDVGVTRTELRADTMIVATAVASGATHIYSHDNHIRRLADGFIIFENIADMVLQTTYLPE